MSQFLRPFQDITTIGITGNYTAIDETNANDADHLFGAENTAITYETKLSAGTDPVSSSGHIFRYRIAKHYGFFPTPGGETVYVTVSLYQGTTLIASDTQKTTFDAWTGYEFTLSGAQADAITDYTNLRLRFVSPASGGSSKLASTRGLLLSWAEMEIPDAGSSPPAPTCNFSQFF